ncbi:MAG: glycosyltransferase [Anaerolineales bacterium]|nr:glycosyltransferase [Anaerolineales bacterium]
MKIVFVSASQVPSDTANSLQVMKVCQAFAQLGHETILLVPANPQSAISLADNFQRELREWANDANISKKHSRRGLLIRDIRVKKANAIQKLSNSESAIRNPSISLRTSPQLATHYGLTTPFEIQWLPVKDRRTFPWTAVRRARRLKADLLYAWPVQSAALGLLAGLPVMLEMHDFPAGGFGRLWFRLFLRLPGKKRLLPITHALRRELERRYRSALPDEQVVTAPDGVDLERYEHLPDPQPARRQLGLPPSPTVVCTGHLYAGRGAGIFLALAAMFPKVNFVWVGGRPQEVDEWRSRAAACGLRNVALTGFLPNERIPLFQAAADVLLMPYERTVSTSSGGDTADICSPMKMFEYMAAGRAILSSDLPVLREVLNENNAVFCPPDDAGAWESSLGELLADSKRRQALGQRARADVKEYSWLSRARRILENFNA